MVHPHLRGAYIVVHDGLDYIFGSSPPTWGIRCSTAPTIDISRFIPTYVGHTASGSSQPPPWPVHPHIRGAYCGSANRRCPRTRFIPTYVGHTSPTPSLSLTPSVHPHIRGAYSPMLKALVPAIGSSPHTWGIRAAEMDGATYISVHPHIRGAYRQRR